MAPSSFFKKAAAAVVGIPVRQAQAARLAGYPDIASSTAAARAQLNPLVSSATRLSNAQTEAGLGAISRASGSALADVNAAAAATKKAYDGAILGQAGVEDALANRLTATNSDAVASLAAKLRAAGLGSTLVPNLQSDAVNAGGTSLARGSAGISSLLQQGAHAQEYLNQIPGEVDRMGIGYAAKYKQGQDQALASRVAALQGQVPGLAAKLYGADVSAYNSEQNREAAAARASAAASAKSAAADAKLNQPSVAMTHQINDGYLYNAKGERVSAHAVFTPKTSGSGSGSGGGSVGTGFGSINAKQTQINQATTKVISAMRNALTMQNIYSDVPKLTKYGAKIIGPDGKPVTERKITGTTPKFLYYEAIHQAEADAANLLGLPLGDPRLTNFVQKIANQYFRPGQYGRPKAISDSTVKGGGPSVVLNSAAKPKSKPVTSIGGLVPDPRLGG